MEKTEVKTPPERLLDAEVYFNYHCATQYTRHSALK